MSQLNDEDRASIIEALRTTDKSQQEIADEHGCSQSTVSTINQALSTGREAGKEEGYEEAYKKASEEFSESLDDETPDEDEYWCEHCMNEEGEKVFIEYMADECPNGHDLSGAWEGV